MARFLDFFLGCVWFRTRVGKMDSFWRENWHSPGMCMVSPSGVSSDTKIFQLPVPVLVADEAPSRVGGLELFSISLFNAWRRAQERKPNIFNYSLYTQSWISSHNPPNQPEGCDFIGSNTESCPPYGFAGFFPMLGYRTLTMALSRTPWGRSVQV